MIDKLGTVEKIIENHFDGVINRTTTEKIRKEGLPLVVRGEISKSPFLRIVHDAFYVASFGLETTSINFEDERLVSFYEVGKKTVDLLSELGITVPRGNVLNDSLFQLTAAQLNKIVSKAPYLIAMEVSDYRQIADRFSERCGVEVSGGDGPTIPDPNGEPTIGVIDTLFDTKAYFSKWVKYEDCLHLPEETKFLPEDYWHGTAVSSIIVDGPRANPSIDDHCGRFQVRHFGVSLHRGYRTSAILREIRRVVSENRYIKVWNLSLGAVVETEEDFISPEAAYLDQLQTEFDVIFVVAGTNVPDGEIRTDMRIGAPADSLNALVVNAVTYNGEPTSYTRVGPVLSFFNKPDVSYYGGDVGDRYDAMSVCRVVTGQNRIHYAYGTSYAAPWIARKVAYLIHYMGLNIQTAKALIIDAAAKWTIPSDMKHRGFGIVSERIEDIVTTDPEEIRFVITAQTDAYETINYQLPVPVLIDKDVHPYVGRATLVYFPECDRKQGVDYTITELDLKFGRVFWDEKHRRFQIDSLDKNRQSTSSAAGALHEEDARKMYRKWDNVKRITETLDKKLVFKKVKSALKTWGLSVISKDRRTYANRDRMRFGIVVTLRAIDGKNRIQEFIESCINHEWRVQRLNVESRLQIFQDAEHDVDLD